MCRFRCLHSLGQYFNDAGRQSGDAPLILPSSLADTGKQEVHPLFSQEDLDEINPSTDVLAFDTLLQDESLSEDVREDHAYEIRMTSTCLFRVVKDRGKVLGHARHVHTSLISKSRF